MSDETRANATVFDYLRWRGDLTLAQDGFNEVDSLILCIISYINLKKLRQLWSFDPKDAMPMGGCVPPADGGGRTAGPVHPGLYPPDAGGGGDGPVPGRVAVRL